jgi:Tol biopolymer transport system component/DNA-binding winged helix-turn-helix (wHTH) protein
MAETPSRPRLVGFGAFEADVQTGELRKDGVKLKFGGQPFQVLAILLEFPGEVVTREELQKRLWPDTFVDVERNLNSAINKIREVLGDSADSPRFVETLPRRGYRFIAPVENSSLLTSEDTSRSPALPAQETRSSASRKSPLRSGVILTGVLLAGAVLLGAGAFFIYEQFQSTPVSQRALTRLTFEDGLQIGATWSPDGRFIAYSSNRGGKFDVWVQQVSGGDPVQVTKGPGDNWQPDWSPDGRYIAYRSEEGEGGLFAIPALGGNGQERKIASFGYYPHWSPDSSEVLFAAGGISFWDKLYVVGVNAGAPREVLNGFLAPNGNRLISAGWHPDGKRITVWLWNDSPYPEFWTVPIGGGSGVRTSISPKLAQQLKEVSVGGGIREWDEDVRFCWSPSGNAIYFERTFGGARNLWRMKVDPQTLQARAIDRLTTGPGQDTEPALSPDGKQLAYSAISKSIRAWVFSFDPRTGKILDEGKPVTPASVEGWYPSLSRDGKLLIVSVNRSGRWQLWRKSFLDGEEGPLLADDYLRRDPAWSPDGRRLAYYRQNLSTKLYQLMVWSAEDRDERPLTDPSTDPVAVWDWSADEKVLLVGKGNLETGRTEIGSFPISAAPHASRQTRRLIFDAAYNVYQAHFSPDGKWIAFEATRSQSTLAESTLFAMRASGGPWVRLTDGQHWDDKPRWSPDGRIVYFLSGREGFYNVRGVHFDPASGKPLGDSFRVTNFNTPGLMVPREIQSVGMSISQDRLVLNVGQFSGSIWSISKADR